MLYADALIVTKLMCLGLRKKFRLSLKNDIPLRDNGLPCDLCSGWLISLGSGLLISLGSGLLNIRWLKRMFLLLQEPIFRVSVDILNNTNFFRAFTASAGVSSIYVQQFWNTLAKDTKTGVYSFQLDELWFNLNVDLLRNGLGITPKDSAHPFVPPPVGDLVSTKKPKPPIIPYFRFTKLIIYYLGSRHNIYRRTESLIHIMANDYPLNNLKFVRKGGVDEVFGMPIPKDLVTDAIQNSDYYNKYLEMVARKPRQSTTMTGEEVEKMKKAPQADEEPQVKDDEYNLQRGIQMSLESLQAPIDEVVIHEHDSRFIQKLLEVEGKGKEERTIKFNEGQAGLDPGKTLESRPPAEEDQAGSDPRQSYLAQAGPNPEPMHEDFIATFYPKVHESLKLTIEEKVHIENPPSSSRTLSSMKNLEDTFTFVDQFLNDKSTEEESGKANVETEVKSMDKTTQTLAYRVYKLENHDLYSKIDKEVNEVVKEAVHNAFQAPLPFTKSRKRRRVDQDPPLPPLKDSDRSKKKKHDSDDSTSKHPLIGKKKLVKADFKDHIDLLNPKDLEYLVSGNQERRHALPISKLKAAYYPDFGLKELLSSTWTESESDYDISSAYGISRWWFKRKEFYIIIHSASFDRNAVRSHMRILSVVGLKTYSIYDYTFLKEIVLRRADYKEYKISKTDFKNLQPNDFKDIYLLNLQGKLNNLFGADKVYLSTAVNLLTRNIVIIKRVEDNITQPRWDATDFLFKEDYTIVDKPRAVIYRDRNNQKKMMQETELHKFSDGTLTRILENLDYMVKDYELFKYNPMKSRIWIKDDKLMSQEFIKLIEKRLKIMRIFRNLKSFVGGRIRDIKYRLIERTE
nr:hypothetical protein [Tanacetum cinerariifolium]